MITQIYGELSFRTLFGNHLFTILYNDTFLMVGYLSAHQVMSFAADITHHCRDRLHAVCIVKNILTELGESVVEIFVCIVVSMYSIYHIIYHTDFTMPLVFRKRAENSTISFLDGV